MLCVCGNIICIVRTDSAEVETSIENGLTPCREAENHKHFRCQRSKALSIQVVCAISDRRTTALRLARGSVSALSNDRTKQPYYNEHDCPSWEVDEKRNATRWTPSSRRNLSRPRIDRRFHAPRLEQIGCNGPLGGDCSFSFEIGGQQTEHTWKERITCSRTGTSCLEREKGASGLCI